jgi:hypothetical protein
MADVVSERRTLARPIGYQIYSSQPAGERKREKKPAKFVAMHIGASSETRVPPAALATAAQRGLTSSHAQSFKIGQATFGNQASTTVGLDLHVRPFQEPAVLRRVAQDHQG